MRSGIYEQFIRLTETEQVAFLQRLNADPAARRHVTVSSSQRWMWFLERMGIAAGVYSSPLVYRFDRALDLAALRAAFDLVCQRHEVLRSRFLDCGGEPVVLVAAEAAPFEVIDLRTTAGPDREVEVERVLQARLSRSFNLATDSPVRCLVIIVDDHETVVAINTHHIATDGQSIRILESELSQAYDAAKAGGRPELAALPLQYIDYAAWQHDYWCPNRLAQEVEHWRSVLSGAAFNLDLPHDRARADRQTFRGATTSAALAASTTKALVDIGRSAGTTPFMVFQALFAIVLGRVCGTDDLLVGAPHAGRHREEFKGLLGLFINTIVLRSDLSGNPSFRELLGRVRRGALEAYAHAELPFEKIVEAIGTDRRFDRNPIFQVMYSHEMVDGRRFTLDGAVARPMAYSDGSAKFDLLLFARQHEDSGCEFTLEYADLFDPATARDLLLDVIRVAEAAAAHPDILIGDLPITTVGRPKPLAQAPSPAPSATWDDAAGDELQRRVHEVWSTLLGRSDFGVHDSFFSLGGSSMAAMQLAFQISQALGVQLDPAAFFDAPTVAGIATRLRAGTDAEPSRPPVVPRRAAPADAPAPLSAAQRRMWLLEQTSGGGAYNLPLVYKVEGPLNLAAMRGAAEEVWRRHSVLQSRFVERDGDVWAVASTTPPEFRVAQLPAGAVAERRRLVEAEILRPFDLSQDTLLRCLVASVSAEDHVVLLNVHHIVADGWTGQILKRELFEAYEQWCSGVPGSRPTPELTYSDYVAWQNDYLASEFFATDLAYWRRTLEGAPESLDLPIDHPRPERQSFRGGSVTVRLAQPLATTLTQIAKRHNASPFMLYLTLWCALLHRYTGQSDLVVGAPDAGRGRPELADIVGLLVNTIVLRTPVRSGDSFADLLARVRDTALAAYAHADVPFEKLVDALAADHTLDRNALFQVYFSYEEASGESAGSDLDFADTTAKFDLDLAVRGAGGGPVDASLAFAADLFDRELVEQMMRHFACLAEAVAGDPDAAVAGIDLLGPESAALTTASRPAPQLTAATAHAYLERQAALTPAAIAVQCGGTALTYAELDRQVNQLAWHLQSQGVGPETLVGLCLPRDERMVIALFAVLKAGGAYVPLDPFLPADRLGYLIGDSQVAVLITDSQCRRRLTVLPDRVVSLDDDGSSIASWPADPPASVVDGSHLAYVLYTSGSTGAPKGVMVEHRSLATLIEFYRQMLRPDQVALVLGASPLGFDASILEIFGTLPLGGTLLIVDTVFDLVKLPDRERVTLLQTVPSLMRELVKQGPLPDRLRTVCLGGEPLPGDLADEVYAAGSVEVVYNIYGPTEETVDTTWGLTPKGTRRPTLGRPLPGTRCYVLDLEGRLLPRGAKGELYLAGPKLSRGYLNRPALTDERFVADPFHPGERMYRTGDLVRLRVSGELEYLGRMDRQVKVRGVRVELGEIESALTDQPAVGQAAVVVRADRLAAYLVVSGSGWDERTVLTALRSRLPAYMVPESYTLLDSMPLTSNGKLDEAALPVPTVAAPTTATPPRTALERELLDIWCQLLGSDLLGVHDNFFDAGGTSFLLISLRARIAERLGHDVHLVSLYEFPTVSSLGRHLPSDSAVDDDQGTSRAQLERRRRAAMSNVDAQLERRRAGQARLARRRTSTVTREAAERPRWLLNRRPRPEAPLQLFCFPHTGGTTSSEYLAWADQLPGIQVWAMQLPGRGSRINEDPVSSLMELVSGIVSEVEFGVPYVFFGHSFGGLLAYETARALQARGLTGPLHLYISACAAPTLEMENLSIYQLEDDEFVREMESAYGKLPKEIHDSPDLMRMILASWRSDMGAAEKYVYKSGPLLDCPITTTGGTTDYESEQRLALWAEQTASTFELKMFEGDHFYFREDPAAWFAYLNDRLTDDQK